MLPNIYYKFSDPLYFTFVKSIHKKTFLGYQTLTLNHGGGEKEKCNGQFKINLGQNHTKLTQNKNLHIQYVAPLLPKNKLNRKRKPVN